MHLYLGRYRLLHLMLCISHRRHRRSPLRVHCHHSRHPIVAVVGLSIGFGSEGRFVAAAAGAAVEEAATAGG